MHVRSEEPQQDIPCDSFSEDTSAAQSEIRGRMRISTNNIVASKRGPLLPRILVRVNICTINVLLNGTIKRSVLEIIYIMVNVPSVTPNAEQSDFVTPYFLACTTLHRFLYNIIPLCIKVSIKLRRISYSYTRVVRKVLGLCRYLKKYFMLYKYRYMSL